MIRKNTWLLLGILLQLLLSFSGFSQSGDFIDKLSNQTYEEFKKIYDYLPSSLDESKRKEAFSVYREAMTLIEEGSLVDPDYPRDYEGKIAYRQFSGQGEFEVAWIDKQPLVIVSLRKFRGRLLFLPETLNREGSSFKRFLYHLHIFSGDNGFGIWDHLVEKPSSSRVQKIKTWFKRFRAKNFVRGNDVTLISVSDRKGFLGAEISRKPGYLSGKWWLEYWGAMTKGRPMTLKKLVSALGIASVPTAFTASFVNMELAAVVGAFTLITQANYEAYVTYKFTHSSLMQILKLAFVSAINNMIYIGISAGAETSWHLIAHAMSNAALGVYVFHHWRLNKQLLLESGKTVGKVNITPELSWKLPQGLAGKSISFFNRRLILPKEFKAKPLTLSKAKIHDTLTDQIPGLGRQAQLAWELHPAMMVGIAFLGDMYALSIYQYAKMKKLKNPVIERIMGEVFHSGLFKKLGNWARSGCNGIFTVRESH